MERKKEIGDKGSGRGGREKRRVEKHVEIGKWRLCGSCGVDTRGIGKEGYVVEEVEEERAAEKVNGTNCQ